MEFAWTQQWTAHSASTMALATQNTLFAEPQFNGMGAPAPLISPRKFIKITCVCVLYNIGKFTAEFQLNIFISMCCSSWVLRFYQWLNYGNFSEVEPILSVRSSSFSLTHTSSMQRSFTCHISLWPFPVSLTLSLSFCVSLCASLSLSVSISLLLVLYLSLDSPFPLTHSLSSIFESFLLHFQNIRKTIAMLPVNWKNRIKREKCTQAVESWAILFLLMSIKLLRTSKNCCSWCLVWVVLAIYSNRTHTRSDRLSAQTHMCWV